MSSKVISVKRNKFKEFYKGGFYFPHFAVGENRFRKDT